MMKRNSLHLMPYFISFIPSSPLFSTNQPTSFRPYWALCTTFIRGLHLHSTEVACPQLQIPQKQNVAFSKDTARSIEIVPRGGPPLLVDGIPFWLMKSRGGPLLGGCMLMNSRGRPHFGGLYVDEF